MAAKFYISENCPVARHPKIALKHNMTRTTSLLPWIPEPSTVNNKLFQFIIYCRRLWNPACTKRRNVETKRPKRNGRNHRNHRNDRNETTETKQPKRNDRNETAETKRNDRNGRKYKLQEKWKILKYEIYGKFY